MEANLPQPAGIPTFSPAERDRRWALARTFMERHGLDALIVFGEHEDAGPAPFCLDAWFTNERAGTTVIFPKTGEPIVFAPITTYLLDHLEASRRGDGGWIAAKNVRLGRQSGEIIDELKEHGLAKGTIGVIGLEPYIPWHPEGIVPYQTWHRILTRFPDVEFKSVGVDLARLMMPLSKEEIAVVRYSAGIGDMMAQAMAEAARPGVSEVEVYAAGMAAAHLRGTVVPGMHFWSGPTPTASGPPQWAYRPQAPRVLQEGDYIATEVFCGFGMHQTQHQVAIAIGQVHAEFEEAALVARASYDAGIEALRPGVTFGEVAEAMLKPTESAGGWVRGPQIHGLNPYGSFCRTPAGLRQLEGAERYGEVPSSPTSLSEMQLEPGMTFAFEPSCGLCRHLVTIGGTVLVGDDGAIELNPSTARLLRASTQS